MSMTPGAVSKLSPFAPGISKNLLTPCRRVGLSRKRKTPGSITKLLSDDLNNSNCSVSEQISPESTPINKKTSGLRKSRVVFDSPKVISSESTIVLKTESTAKKSLNKCFKRDTLVTETCIESTNSPNVTNNLNKNFTNVGKTTVDVEKNDVDDVIVIQNSDNSIDRFNLLQKNVEICGTPNIIPSKDDSSSELSSALYEYAAPKVKASNVEHCKENISEPEKNNSFKNKSSNNSESFIVKELLKEQCIVDDSLKVEDNLRAKVKTYERKKLSEKNSSSSNITDLKVCQISIPKLSEEDIKVLGGGPEVMMPLSDDEEPVSCKKKRKSILSDDENDDFQGSSNVVSQKTKIHSPKKSIEKKMSKEKKSSKEKKPSKEKKGKLSKVSSMVSVSTFEEDEDAFTSTPDREKNEKRDLIDKIKALEKIVNDKRTKLDNLKRASVYRSKHNIDELRAVTEQWKQGCVMGLNGLLNQLKTHGPIDMPTLLRNLQIPSDIATKLFDNVT